MLQKAAKRDGSTSIWILIMSKALYQHAGDELALINNVFTVIGVNEVEEGKKYVVNVKCPLWAYILPCKSITNGANEYIVTNILQNADGKTYDLHVSGLEIDTETPLIIKRPFYFHGTIVLTNNELDTIKNNKNKYPMCYFYEVLKENYDDELSMIEKRGQVRMFFLAEADTQKWTTDCHYKNVVEPMERLAKLFIKHIHESCKFDDLQRYSITRLANFGNYDKNGNFAEIFTEQLSGVELSFELAPKKDLSLCQDNC